MLDYTETFYIDSSEKTARAQLTCCLTSLLYDYKKAPVFLCIGSEKVSGDALGPLIGSLLLEKRKDLSVFGTLTSPVHAVNLPHTIAEIHQNFPENPVIAIDASLGIREHLHYLTIGRGSLEPGAGVHKLLGSVGDIFLTGIVAQAGPFSQFALQRVPPNTVYSLAHIMAEGILAFFQSAEHIS